MKILYAGTLPPHPGGSAISGSQIVLGLAARGHEVRAVAPIEARLVAGGDAFARQHPEMEVRRFEVESSLTLTYLSPEGRPEGEAAAALVSDFLREGRPDVVFLGREGFAFGCVDVARQAGVPIVLRVAGGTLTGIVSGTYASVGAYTRPGRSPMRWDDAWLEAVTPIDLLITPADHMRVTLERLGVKRVLMIPNAIDLAQFNGAGDRAADAELRRRLRIGDADVVVACVANLHSRKRPLDVIASAALALRKDPRLFYVLAGEGNMRPQVEKACRDAGIEDRVSVLGWVEYEQIPALLRVADIVLLASESEGLARASVEAQAAGKVLIVTDIPPSHEVVSHGEDGFLFPVGDVERLTALTLEAAANPGLRQRVGRAATERVRSRSIGAAVVEYERQLVRVIEQRDGG